MEHFLKKIKIYADSEKKTIKTGIAIFICLIGYAIFNQDHPLYAVAAALICIQNAGSSTTFRKGIERFSGTVIGASFGIIVYSIHLRYSSNHVHALTVGLGMVLILFISDKVKALRNTGTISSLIFALVLIGLKGNQKPFDYAVYRAIDTLVGVIIATFVDKFIYPEHVNTNEFEVARSTSEG